MRWAQNSVSFQKNPGEMGSEFNIFFSKILMRYRSAQNSVTFCSKLDPKKIRDFETKSDKKRNNRVIL